jgi:hypothetical protein
MNNSYGPPQVFKPVCTKTGKSGTVFEISPYITAVKKSGEAVWSLPSHIPLIVCDSQPAFYQSTGHKDKTGADVYFGDKLVDKEGVIWSVVYDASICAAKLQDIEPVANFETSMGYILPIGDAARMQTIGNIHTPHDELMRTAEGVRDGE